MGIKEKFDEFLINDDVQMFSLKVIQKIKILYYQLKLSQKRY